MCDREIPYPRSICTVCSLVEQEKVVPVFVYGSLREGYWNFDWASKCVMRIIKNVTAQGHLWFAYENGFPVAMFSDTTDVIHGEILFCVKHVQETYERMYDMEISAGYEERKIKVTLETGRVMDVIGFHYVARAPDPALFIESGDWTKEYNR